MSLRWIPLILAAWILLPAPALAQEGTIVDGRSVGPARLGAAPSDLEAWPKTIPSPGRVFSAPVALGRRQEGIRRSLLRRSGLKNQDGEPPPRVPAHTPTGV